MNLQKTKKKPYWILKENTFIFSQIEPFLLLQMFPLKYMKKISECIWQTDDNASNHLRQEETETN